MLLILPVITLTIYFWHIIRPNIMTDQLYLGVQPDIGREHHVTRVPFVSIGHRDIFAEPSS